MFYVDEFEIVETWAIAESVSSSWISEKLVSTLSYEFEKDLLRRHENLKMPTGVMSPRQSELLFVFERAYTRLGRPEGIRVLDFGGGNGYMYDWVKREYPALDISWLIIETQPIAEAYEQIGFTEETTWSSIIPKENFDLCLASCVFQYCKEPFELLSRILLQSKCGIFLRLAALGGESVLTVQRPKAGLYAECNASWPSWFFSFDEIESEIQREAYIVSCWESGNEGLILEGEGYPLVGYYLESKKL